MLNTRLSLSAFNSLKIWRKMSVFVQQLNAITGNSDWVVKNEDYDYYQEVARSAFADMLHDTERNQLYEKALKKAIDAMHARGKPAHVLDIGTGTGLLSMMAVRHGADSVTACEAFAPVAECARKIIKDNGFGDKIKIIPLRSTEITVGPSGQLPHRCNILVTEVFDTELIGEGALSTFNHAHKVLLEKDCLVVPHSATIYAQIIESPTIKNFNRVQNIFDDDGEVLVQVPDYIQKCTGSAAVHDVQINEIPLTTFNSIAGPVAVLDFDWSGQNAIKFGDAKVVELISTRSGEAQAVFMWWDLKMDFEGEYVLSCAPYWTRNQRKEEIPWRDHWMQAIYYFPKECRVKEGDRLFLLCGHDEYSLWFNLVLNEPNRHLAIYQPPICTCMMHASFSRNRIGQLNDQKRNKKYLALINKYVNKNSFVLVLGNSFYLGLAACKKADIVYILEDNILSQRIMNLFIEKNNFKNAILIKSLEDAQKILSKKINLVIGESYFITSILPWDNILYKYHIERLKSVFTDDVKFILQKAVIKAIAVRFSNLHKIRLPLGKCEGFSMHHFDQLIDMSSKISDDNVEAQPLWEYPAVALSDVTEIAIVDLVNGNNDSIRNTGNIDVKGNGECNGIAIWVDWLLDDSTKTVFTSGPIIPTEINKEISWYMYVKQGVHLFLNKKMNSINYIFDFNVKEGNISFKFNTN